MLVCTWSVWVREGCVPPACVDSQEVWVTKSKENVDQSLMRWRLHHTSAIRAALDSSEGPCFESWWWQWTFFFRLFPFVSFPPTSDFLTWAPRVLVYTWSVWEHENCVPLACVDSQEVWVTMSGENVEQSLLGWRIHHSSVVRASLATSQGPWFESWWCKSIISSDFFRLCLSLKPVNNNNNNNLKVGYWAISTISLTHSYSA